MSNAQRRLIRALMNLERDLDDAFESVIDDPWGRRAGDTWSPAVDVEETRDAYVVSVDLPGCRSQDIELQVSEHEVTVYGVRHSTRAETSARRLHVERRVGAFRRTIALEHAVDPESATARCEAGVHEVRIQKRKTDDTREEGKK